MALVYSTAVETDRMTATRDYHANGTLEIQTSAGAVLATFGLSASGGTVTTDSWTLVFDAGTVTASGTGTAAKAVIKNSGGTVGVTDALTVGLTSSGADIELDSVSFTSGQNVSLSTSTLTHA